MQGLRFRVDLGGLDPEAVVHPLLCLLGEANAHRAAGILAEICSDNSV